MSDHKRDVERLIEDGLIRYGGGDLAGALAAWERALIQEPGNLQAVGYIDYVRQVFEQLNRPTRDELVVPFGLGHGDAPDYQIEIAPEPPDDEAVERGGGLQDGWPIGSDDERETVDRLYSTAEPPGTLDLELDDASELDIDSPEGLQLEIEVTSALDDLTPVMGMEVAAGAASGAASSGSSSGSPSSASSSAAPRGGDTRDSDGFEGPEQEMTPGFLEGEAAQRDSTPGFGDVSGNSTDLKRPDLGFVKPRTANTVRRGEASPDAPDAPDAPEARDARDGRDARDSRGYRGTESPSSGIPQPVSEESRAPTREGSRDARESKEARDAAREAARDAREVSLDAPTQPRPSRRAIGPESRPSKPGLEVPTDRPSRSALAAPGGSGSRRSIPLPPPPPSSPFSQMSKDNSDENGLSASEREPTRPRQAVSALLAMANAGNAGAVPRLPTRPSEAPRPAPGLLDPWSELAEGNASGPDDYANLEMAPLIEELSPAESGESETLPPSPSMRPEAMTRDLGLAGRYKPREDLKFGEESPTRELMRPGAEDEEKTQAWATVPGAPAITDALDILTAQISPRLERDVPPGESKDDRLRRRIATLVEVANEYSRLGDMRRAVAAADLALGEDPDSALSQKLLHRNREAILAIFQGFLGSLERRPSLAKSLFALGTAPIGARAAFLLSRVDGHLTYDEILDVSGMPRLEAYRYLCQLHIRGILSAE